MPPLLRPIDPRLPPPKHPALLQKFTRWWRANTHPQTPFRWRRLPSYRARLLEQIGVAAEIDAPLFFGGTMRVVSGEPISMAILGFGYAEPTLTAVMLHFLGEGGSFLDVGTHFGYEALLGARLVGPAGRGQAFEPNPAASALAVHNLRSHPQVTVHTAAVGATAGEISFTAPSLRSSAFNRLESAGPAGQNVRVPVVTLDHRYQATGSGPVDLIKCDVEGRELEVLQGARRILTERTPLLILESGMPPENEIHPRIFEFAHFLAEWGYRPLAFDFDGRLRLGAVEQLACGHPNVLFAAPKHGLF